MDHRAGDAVRVDAPGGSFTCRILKGGIILGLTHPAPRKLDLRGAFA